MASNDYIVEIIDKADVQSSFLINGFEKTIMIVHDVIEITEQLFLISHNQIPFP